MAENRNRPETGEQEAVRSETQRVLSQMREGEAWSHRAAALGYLAGGIGGPLSGMEEGPEPAGEEGRPTPT